MKKLEISFFDEIEFLDGDKQAWIEKLLDLAHQEVNPDKQLEMSITFVSREKIQEINQKYRAKDRATDVISFAINDDDDLDFNELMADGNFYQDIGDLFICIDVVKEHAKEYEHSFDREFGYCLVHGYLHLNGFDHIDPADNEKMIGLQEKILEMDGLKRWWMIARKNY